MNEKMLGQSMNEKLQGFSDSIFLASALRMVLRADGETHTHDTF